MKHDVFRYEIKIEKIKLKKFAYSNLLYGIINNKNKKDGVLWIKELFYLL